MSKSAAVSIMPKGNWKQTSEYISREVCGSQHNPANSYVDARHRRAVGRGVGADEPVPRWPDAEGENGQGLMVVLLFF